MRSIPALPLREQAREATAYLVPDGIAARRRRGHHHGRRQPGGERDRVGQAPLGGLQPQRLAQDDEGLVDRSQGSGLTVDHRLTRWPTREQMTST